MVMKQFFGFASETAGFLRHNGSSGLEKSRAEAISMPISTRPF